MGNRGDLHAADGTLGRQWRSQRWISCILDCGGSRRPMDAPGHYYPLFFHDEAVALAAGHRPCGECRPEALSAFIAAWKAGRGWDQRDCVPLREIDRSLHSARTTEMRRRYPIALFALPDGAFVWVPGIDARPLLKLSDWLLPWQHGDYGNPIKSATITSAVYQLTPAPIVGVLRSGYIPAMHLNRRRHQTQMSHRAQLG